MVKKSSQKIDYKMLSSLFLFPFFPTPSSSVNQRKKANGVRKNVRNYSDLPARKKKFPYHFALFQSHKALPITTKTPSSLPILSANLKESWKWFPGHRSPADLRYAPLILPPANERTHVEFRRELPLLRLRLISWTFHASAASNQLSMIQLARHRENVNRHGTPAYKGRMEE